MSKYLKYKKILHEKGETNFAFGPKSEMRNAKLFALKNARMRKMRNAKVRNKPSNIEKYLSISSKKIFFAQMFLLMIDRK